MLVSGHIPLLELVALLAPTLGQEKSHDVVEEAARALGITADEVETAVALRLLEALGKESGIVGVAARFARQRFESRPAAENANAQEEPPISSGPSSAPSSAPSSSPTSAASSAASSGGPSSGPRRIGGPRHGSTPKRTVERHSLVALLAPTLGQEKAEDVVVGALRLLGLPEDNLDQRQALAMLEQLAGVPGLVGVTARFAKARVILLFSPS
jgi:hypothetical protein